MGTRAPMGLRPHARFDIDLTPGEDLRQLDVTGPDAMRALRDARGKD